MGMTVNEVAPVPAGALPLAALGEHLRHGSGFGADAVQDGLLERHLRAALAMVEGETALAILQREFLLSVEEWPDETGFLVPVGRATALVSATLRDAGGAALALPPGALRLSEGQTRRRLLGAGAFLPAIPAGGRAEIVLHAGWPDWAAVPDDLAQAVFMLAAHFDEARHVTGEGATVMPYGSAALLGRWRPLRLGARGR